jgi:hypothetical protein
MKTNASCVGITLLYAKKEGKIIEGQLKSYVVNAINWKQLQNALKDIVQKQTKDAEIEYLGLYDVFYVSGSFKENNILGKSCIDDLNTKRKSKSLVKKRKDYSCLELKSLKPFKWLLVSLVYFYENRQQKDFCTVTCLTPIKSNDLSKVIKKVREVSVKKSFKKKIFRPLIDQMDSKNLSFVGIEDIYVVRENPEKSEAFQTLYSDYKNINALKKMLPGEEELKGYNW